MPGKYKAAWLSCDSLPACSCIFACYGLHLQMPCVRDISFCGMHLTIFLSVATWPLISDTTPRMEISSFSAYLLSAFRACETVSPFFCRYISLTCSSYLSTRRLCCLHGRAGLSPHFLNMPLSLLEYCSLAEAACLCTSSFVHLCCKCSFSFVSPSHLFHEASLASCSG